MYIYRSDIKIASFYSAVPCSPPTRFPGVLDFFLTHNGRCIGIGFGFGILEQHMFQSYQRKVFFRHHLLETFRNGDPEGLDALLECDNPFGHFNFRCHHDTTLTKAISEAAEDAQCNKQVIVNMYSKLLVRGLDRTERPIMLPYLVYAHISVELMEILVPSQEEVKNIAEILHRAWVAVSGKHLCSAQGVTVDVDLLNVTKHNMSIFKNLPTVQEYIKKAVPRTVLERTRYRRCPSYMHPPLIVSRLIDDVLNT